MRVSEMAVTERPDSRLLSIGASSLAVSELILLTDSRMDTGVINRLLVANGGSLRRLAMLSPRQFQEAGLTAKQAVRIAAVFELARRHGREIVPDCLPIRNSRDIVAYFGPRLQDLNVEEFHVAVLDMQHRMVRDILLTRGLLNSSMVHPREVFRAALAEKAAAIILVHNHPSGDPAPSVDDRAITDQLVAASKVMDIPIHDHVIIGQGLYTSMAETGLL